MNDSSTSSSSATAAAAHLIGVLAAIAGALGGLSAIKYYVGWREQTAYYARLGCPWFVSMLTTSDFIQVSTPLLLGICTSAFVMFERILQGRNKPEIVARILKWAGIMAALGITALTFDIDQYVGIRASRVVAVITLILLGTNAGWLIGDLISRLAQSSLQWQAQHLNIVYLLIAYGAWQLPDNDGRFRADIDSDSTSSRLAHISIPASASTDDWRIVAAVDKELLVMSLSEPATARHFRIIEAKDASTYPTTAPPRALRKRANRPGARALLSFVPPELQMLNNCMVSVS